jgi:hypothetical protein
MKGRDSEITSTRLKAADWADSGTSVRADVTTEAVRKETELGFWRGLKEMEDTK